MTLLLGFVLLLFTFAMSCIVMIANMNSLSPRVKANFISAFAALIVCMIAEYITVEAVNWNLGNAKVVMSIAKSIEHVFSPLALLFASTITNRSGKRYRVFIIPVVLLNAALSIASIFTGWTFSFDEAGHYSRGPVYFIFIAIVALFSAIVVVVVYRDAKRFQRPNFPTLVAVIFIFVLGFTVHSLNADLHTTWIGAIVAMGMFTLYYMDLNLQLDPVSGLMNRRSYVLAIEKVDYPIAYLMMDIDGFKALNDTMGHQYGDECLDAIGDAMLVVFSKYGTCYRVGGDEFVVILRKKLDSVDKLIEKFNEKIEELKQVFTPIKSISVGYAIIHNDEEKDQKLVDADVLMYKEKNMKKAKKEETE